MLMHSFYSNGHRLFESQCPCSFAKLRTNSETSEEKPLIHRFQTTPIEDQENAQKEVKYEVLFGCVISNIVSSTTTRSGDVCNKKLPRLSALDQDFCLRNNVDKSLRSPTTTYHHRSLHRDEIAEDDVNSARRGFPRYFHTKNAGDDCILDLAMHLCPFSTEAHFRLLK
jgi:hypothetical protein